MREGKRKSPRPKRWGWIIGWVLSPAGLARQTRRSMLRHGIGCGWGGYRAATSSARAMALCPSSGHTSWH